MKIVNLKLSGTIIPSLLIFAVSAAAQIEDNPSPATFGSSNTTSGAVQARPAVASRRSDQAALPVGPGNSFYGLQPNNSMVTTVTSGAVKLGAGDLLDISVFASPELTARVRVTSEGEISFPLLGKLRASGMTPQEFQGVVRDQLIKRNFVKDPQVAVFVLEYADQVVYVLGEVTKPGPYPVVGSHRLFDFISAAGGFTSLAGKSIKITSKAHPESPLVARFSRELNVSADNIEVGPGDTIVVGQAGVIYVVGNVMHPGGFLLDGDQRLTVMKALALAAGPSPAASMKNACLIRTTPQGREEIPFDLRKVMASKVPDLVLQDQDILYVPNSAMRSGVNRALEAMQASVGAAIYRF